jgi:hypothetical protein
MAAGAADQSTAFDPSRYAAEAERRWGGGEAYRESMRRTGRYGADQWTAIQAESEAVVRTLATLMAAGVEPTAVEAMDAAEAHRRHIDRWFYPCNHALHGSLADMYVDDRRFPAYFERRGAGLAHFVRETVAANAARHRACAAPQTPSR